MTPAQGAQIDAVNAVEQSPFDGPMTRDATLSHDGVYRYLLSRTWIQAGTRVTWVMLNPSTADAENDDPTIRRCIGFSRRWGFDGLNVVNLYALRATDPAELGRHPDPVGPDNLDTVHHALGAEMVVVAWGVHPAARRHPSLDRIRDMLSACDVRCVGRTNDGSPRHPLYVRADAAPNPWTAP